MADNQNVKALRLNMANGIEDNIIDLDNMYSATPFSRSRLIYNMFVETASVSELNHPIKKLALRPTINAKELAVSNTYNYPRGMFYWPKTNSVYYCYNNAVYRHMIGTAVNDLLISTVSTPGGTNYIGFAIFYDGSVESLFVCDGSKAWSISTGHVVTDIDNPVNGLPTPHQPSPVLLDGYMFLAKKGDIYNSENGNIIAWNPSSFITTEQYADDIQALTKHRGLLVAFGKNSTEFYSTVATSSPNTPLALNEAYTSKVGLYKQHSFVEYEDVIYFVGIEQHSHPAVYKIEGAKISKVSNKSIERVLKYFTKTANGAYPYNYKMMALPAHGHRFVLIQLFQTDFTTQMNTAGEFNCTLVFDITENAWYAWGARNIETPTVKAFNMGESGSNTRMNALPLAEIVTIPDNFIVGGDACNTYALGLFNQSIYQVGSQSNVNAGEYNNSTPIDWCVRSNVVDYDISLNKYLSKVFLYGNRQLAPFTDISCFFFPDNTKQYSSSFVFKGTGETTFGSLPRDFRQMQFELQGSSVTPVILEGLETHIRLGTN